MSVCPSVGMEQLSTLWTSYILINEILKHVFPEDFSSETTLYTSAK